MGRSPDPIEGDHSGIGCDASHNPQDDDHLTYVTPEIEVYSGVFIDEKVGDTVKEVTSPISGEKKRVRKRGKVLYTPYIVLEHPKRRTKETTYNPLRPVEPSRLDMLLRWVSNVGNPISIWWVWVEDIRVDVGFFLGSHVAWGVAF